ncbi:MAG: aminotransferase class V-fold PLP-dependent enzyme [Anaeroplasmataceae bacterium]
MLDPKKIKKDFPIFDTDKDLVYLDSGASSLKPLCVIEKMDYYLKHLGVNVHRGVYQKSYEATELYEKSRENIAKFINADFEEIVFTRGASASLNLVALSYGLQNINEDDEVITSQLEHHSSHLPWYKVCKIKKAKLIYVPLDSEGRITLDNLKSVITSKTKVIALTHVSNVMGYITPIEDIIKEAHKHNIVVSVDACQSIPHMPIDVKKMDCDFLSFSGHKMCGPTGVGVLYGKKHLLDKMEPIEFGGDMADIVTLDSLSYKAVPYKFETGTPMITEVIGLSQAVDYLLSIGLDNIKQHEQKLTSLAIKLLKEIKEVQIYNPTCETGIISFNIKGIHPHDAASIYDKNHVCIRAGHHCAQLITAWLNQISTTRASFYLYNTEEDVYKFIESVKEAIKFFNSFN